MMGRLIVVAIIITISIVLATCYESSSEKPPPPPVVPPLAGVAVNGSIYYQNNCGSCHKAGRDDPASAFGASDLAQRHARITSDMSNFDATSTFNLMGAFSNIPAQRVVDLKAYLESVPMI